MSRRIDISHKTIFFIAGFLALLWMLFLIKDLILLLFVSVIFLSALSPIVDRLVSWKIPRALGIAVVYIIIIALLSGIVTVGLVPITTQASGLTQQLTSAVNSLAQGAFFGQRISLKDQLPNVSQNLVNFTVDIFKSFITAVLVAVITFYMLLDKNALEVRFAKLFGDNQAKVHRLIEEMEKKLGAWLRGQVLLSVIVAAFVYIGLTALGIQYALPLAIISGLFEVVPIVGPILSAIPGILIALTISPLWAGLTAGIYLLVQQLESHIIVPQLMKRVVGLNPLVVILAIAVGSRLLGVGGALLAVPIAVLIQIILDDYLKDEEKKDKAS